MCGFTSLTTSSSTLTGPVGPAIQEVDVNSFIAKYLIWVSWSAAFAGGSK